MKFPGTFLDQLISRSDIFDIVSRYVRLKKSGTNYFGLCPFHNEKTPSFSVNADRQTCHCFGCGAGGSVINFIMMAEHLEFQDAVAFLAKLAGMELPESADDRQYLNRPRKLLELNKEAARFYFEILASPDGRPANEYFLRRGLTENTIKRFGLGYAPKEWDSLLHAMTNKNYEKSELEAAGLVVKNKSGGFYDRFRNRVMFPIIDAKGDVIGFGGRVLDNSLPKYLNSPETQIFNKRRNLFALNLAKRENSGVLILTEGYMDVISLHQAGFRNAVASLGTSLTSEQADLIRKRAKEVVIAYDADDAGQAAINRAIEVLRSVDVKIKVLRIPGAKDPDEFIKANGAETFQALLDRAENHMAFLLANLEAKYDVRTDEGKVGYLKETAKLLSALTNDVEREVYAHRAAEVAGVTLDALQSEITKNIKNWNNRERRTEQRKSMMPLEEAQPKVRGIRYEHVKSAMAEEGIIAAIAEDAGVCDLLLKQGIQPEDFTSECLGKAYNALLDRYHEGLSTEIVSLTQELTDTEMANISKIITVNSLTQNSKAIEDYIGIIKLSKVKSAEKKGIDPLIELSRTMKSKKGYGGKER